MSQSTVLIVDDDVSLQDMLCDLLLLDGFKVMYAMTGKDAQEKISTHAIDLVVSDARMKSLDGHTLLQYIKSIKPELPVILMTGAGTVQSAVKAMQKGAADYLVKPFDPNILIEIIKRIVVPLSERHIDLVAADRKSLELKMLAKRVATSTATIMITGESGTGKEVFARYIHHYSTYTKGSFVPINCAAIPEHMLEAILFGYERGAFTGAYESKSGKFELANGGTLLLDEISEMDLGLQAKLLRVLQEKEVERLGGRKAIPLNVRVLATSNRNLAKRVREGKFREDLYYRLNVFPLHIPPLRERPADILPLTQKFIVRHGTNARFVKVTQQAQHLLESHNWPGNVRELDNVIQRALILKKSDAIIAEDIRFENFEVIDDPGSLPLNMNEAYTFSSGGLDDGLKNREQELILNALNTGGGSRKRAAALLGISPRTLRYKLARLREAGIAIPS